LTQAAILIAAVVSIIAWPQIFRWLGLSRPASILATASHGIVVFVTVLSSFALALYTAPDRNRPLEWITPASLFGTLVLLGVSLVFRIYAQNWANYSATYGSLAGIVVLMSWISSVVLLIPAELDQVIEDASPFARRHARRPECGATLEGRYTPVRFSK
jgi:membrane protein